MTTPSGIWLVARQEFRMRLRTGRWKWLLGGWLVLLAVFTGLLDLSVSTGYGYVDDDQSRRGVPIFGILMFFVLGMVMVISPALTSQAINGDRERGTLATLQVTRLRPGEIALGKLLAGWGVGLVMLALSLPFAGLAMAKGGITVARLAAVYGVVALLIGVVCAVSQALSALLARSITSALLSYLTVAFLCVGTLISFALIAPLVADERTVQTPEGYAYTDTRSREDRVWWLLAPNPFVILADSAPRVPPRLVDYGDAYYYDDYDPLSSIGREVRELRRPPSDGDYDPNQADVPPVWPWGLGFNVLLGIGSVVLTTRRLRTPSRTLARGVRIA
jgi:ABC-type transport system involved in multi-copper enzyme maturation permease subunit